MMTTTSIMQRIKKGSMKGLPGIRVMIFASLVIMLFMWFMLYFVVNYQKANGVTVNATISTAYNSSNPAALSGVFGNLTGFTTLTNSTKNNFLSGNPINDIIAIIQLAMNLVVYPIKFYFSIFQFIAVPIQAMGIPTGISLGIADATAMIIPIIILISAYFLKDV